MRQEDIDNLNKEQAMEVGRQFAFPLFTGSGYPTNGLTKREYMATQIMSGLLNKHDTNTAVQIAIGAVDKLLIELNKKQ